MERITVNSAQQSLAENGFRFTAPPIQPEMGWYCADCWWSSRSENWESTPQWTPRHGTMGQSSWHQQEMAQSLLRERGLRQLLAIRDARIQQLERRSRRYAQMRNLLETTNKRLERLEQHLGVLQRPPRVLTPLYINVESLESESPITTADQCN